MTINVNPDILVWARKTAGLSVEDAAPKLQLGTSARSSAVEKLTALESGEKSPTRNQLSIMANVYRRPLLTFYMAEPPRTDPRGTDFRRSPGTCGVRKNALLDALLRDVRARQEMVRDILIDEDDFESLDFVSSITKKQGVDAAAAAIADVLKFDSSEPRPRDEIALFQHLREAAGDAGVFVLVLGDLGSYHSAIPPSVFRGLAIADPVAPFIVINARDARTARAFTLIHELAHICLGQTGVSGSLSTDRPRTRTARIERFCNDVAGEVLLPGQQFLQCADSINTHDTDACRTAINTIARRWSVSEPMVAYRLHRIGALNDTTYNVLRKDFEERWQAKLARDRRSGGFPDPKVMKPFSLGDALLGVVHRHVRDSTLSHTKAAVLLGSKPSAVEPLLREFEARQDFFVSRAEA